MESRVGSSGNWDLESAVAQKEQTRDKAVSQFKYISTKTIFFLYSFRTVVINFPKVATLRYKQLLVSW